MGVRGLVPTCRGDYLARMPFLSFLPFLPFSVRGGAGAGILQHPAFLFILRSFKEQRHSRREAHEAEAFLPPQPRGRAMRPQAMRGWEFPKNKLTKGKRT